jgi:hypothetical protein
MKFKSLGLAVAAVLASMAFASTASATTLETNGVANAGAVTTHASAESELVLTATSRAFANACSESTIESTTTTPFTGTRVGGPVSTLTFGACVDSVTVHRPGYLEVENISGTTNGTIFSKSAEVTTGSPFGNLTCRTAAAGTDLGTFTGGVTGTIDINAVINCGFFLPSARFEGKYIITSGPNGVTS